VQPRIMLNPALPFASAEIEKLLGDAARAAWTVADDPLWDQPLDNERIERVSSASLLQDIPGFKALSITQRNEVIYREGLYHLHNLMAGENLGVFLAAQIIRDCPDDSLDCAYFTSTVLADERNHMLALRRYLREKAGVVFSPNPALAQIFDELMRETSYEVKLFVAQLCLEWTAVSLITSIQYKNPEPLLRNILAAIVRDEGRHLRFNRWVFAHLSNARIAELQPRMEEMFFETTVAIVASFFAIPVWQQYGFAPDACRHYALRDLHARGAMRYFTQILPKQLERCRFKSARLIRLLETELEQRVIAANLELPPPGIATDIPLIASSGTTGVTAQCVTTQRF
jgi:hypothetical protein